ncbi:MAG: PolC-type DNA polymerase III [Bacilli bacterium]|nr:PolC-type DNA polymerase III [Bacilli bacterium]
MDKEIKNLLEKLEIDSKYYSEFDNATVGKVSINKKYNVVSLYLNTESNLSIELYEELERSLNNFFNSERSLVFISPKNRNIDYFNKYFNKAFHIIEKKNPIINIFSDRLIKVDDNYYVEALNKAEQRQINGFLKDINNYMNMYGYSVNISTQINEEKRNDIKHSIDSEKEKTKEEVKEIERKIEEKKKEEKILKKQREEKIKIEKEQTDESVLKGRAILDKVKRIKDLVVEEDSVSIEGELFGVETFEPASHEFKIITLKVTDYTDSITAKLFLRDEEEYNSIISKLKSGVNVKLRGYTKVDKYSASELVLNLRDINVIEKEVNKRVDTYPRKRIELHSHTKMSDMDSVCDEVALVKQAIKWGHPGIAITDHDCCQAFPHVYSEVSKYNKGLDAPVKDAKKKVAELEKEVEEHPEKTNLLELAREELEEAKEKRKNTPNFKALYGCELEMSEDYLNVVYNSTNKKIDDIAFVVFDTETTGFNAGLGDSMIEIGAVKVKNGVITDERFDELINPGRHIDSVITNLTGISDFKVRDADNEENVVKRFKEFIGDAVLVAHNAKFDKSMLDMAYYKYGLGKLTNPIVDTLNLSRVINKDLKRHSLSALTKFYKIEMDEVDNEDDEDRVETVEEDSAFESDFSGIKEIKVNGNIAYSDVDKKLIQVEFEEESEVEIEVVYNNSSITSVINYGSRKENIKPGKNNILIKYVDDNIEKEVNITVNKVRSHHRADYDAEKTAEMFLKMLGGIKDLKDLSELSSVEFLCEKSGQTLNPLETEYDNIPHKTVAEKVINDNSRAMHVNLIAKNKIGLKNLFKIISYANTGFLLKYARIPRRIIEENREGILIGSCCESGEIFDIALTRTDEDLIKAMEFYDYIEVQPPTNYLYLVRNRDINSLDEIKEVINKIIRCAKKCGKIICATGDVHNINKEDLIYREIIVNQSSPSKGRHPLARYLNRKGIAASNEDLFEKIKRISKEEFNDELTLAEEKVVKIIISLSEFKNIKITRNNLYELYIPEDDEEIFKRSKTGEEKKEAINNALRKFESRGFIKSKYLEEGIEVYLLKDGFKDALLGEDPEIPNEYFRTTDEMMEEFSFLDKDLAEEIVIDNPKKVADLVEEIEVIEYPEVPFSPIIEDSQKIVTDMVYDKCESIYGKPLPYNIEERLSKELYGDCVFETLKKQYKEKYPDKEEADYQEELYAELNKTVRSGFENIKNILREDIKKDDPDLDEEKIDAKMTKTLGGVIGGGFDVIYLIAQKLVKHSNDDGYLVGSRGSVGSSFVATMMGITEVNPLPAHYVCPKCKHSIFEDEEGNSLGATYSSGVDLPDFNCPKCGTLMNKNGQDMPFATFLGFNADKVPDIDLNFSGDNQASAHEYTKELFGTDNVYRAGTIGTVADKTAYGFVQGYEEFKEFDKLKVIMNSYGLKPPSKDELKKKGLIKSRLRSCETERISIGCTGVKRTTGQHPGGIVVVPGYRDVFDFTPFQYPANDPTVPWRTTHFDYHAIDQDLLKLDILGHDDPTVLRLLQDLSKEAIELGDDKNTYPINENGEVDVTCVPLDDKDTMQIFSSTKSLGVSEEEIMCPTGTLGVPEFGTKFVIQMLVDTRPTTFSELIKISGLSHGTDVWLGNAQDLIANKIVPFKEVIGCRDDIMVYLSYHGVVPIKAFKIMEFVRKGKASKEPKEWANWKQVMLDAKIEPWFIDSCQKIKYMFPKAHAAAYVTSAFRIAWYKVHHPILYYAAYFSIRCEAFDIDAMVRGYDGIKNKLLEIDEKGASATNKEKDTSDVLRVCLEAAARGIKFKNVDINESDGKYFKIDKDRQTLILPFRAMDGLGENVAQGIVEEREKEPFISIEDLQKRGHVSKTLIDNMSKMGILDGLSDSNQLTLF